MVTIVEEIRSAVKKLDNYYIFDAGKLDEFIEFLNSHSEIFDQNYQIRHSEQGLKVVQISELHTVWNEKLPTPITKFTMDE